MLRLINPIGLDNGQELDGRIAAADGPIRKLQDEMLRARQVKKDEIVNENFTLASHTEMISGLEAQTVSVEKCALLFPSFLGHVLDAALTLTLAQVGHE